MKKRILQYFAGFQQTHSLIERNSYFFRILRHLDNFMLSKFAISARPSCPTLVSDLNNGLLHEGQIIPINTCGKPTRVEALIDPNARPTKKVKC